MVNRCKYDGCGKALREKNKSGFCDTHRFYNQEIKCKTCAKFLFNNNTSGYCRIHVKQSKEYKKREKERIRQKRKVNPQYANLTIAKHITNNIDSTETWKKFKSHCAMEGYIMNKKLTKILKEYLLREGVVDEV